MTARVAWILAAAATAALAAPARAETADERRALDHLDRGVAAYRAGDYARARSELAAASALAPDRANPYRWLALTEVELGDCREALIHIESFLSRAPAGDPRVGEMVAVRTRCVAPPPSVVATAPPPAPAPAPPQAEPSIVHRWWFWTAIGAAVITAAGVTTYALTRDGDARLPPVTCGATGCRP
ncbi:MAG TPA: hypothetical protein VFP84_05925 [Kofleriaceae bacterium]|nr:hypothetical protein [Kofleriaceae bacterium]